MNDKNSGFKDIVLEKNPKKEKTKKILLRAIILIIVFLVVIILMKFLNSSPKDELAKNAPVPPPPAVAEQKQSFENSPIVQEKTDDEYSKLLESMKENNESENTFKEPPVKELEKEANTQAKTELKEEVKSEGDDAKKIVHEAFVKPGSTPTKPKKQVKSEASPQPKTTAKELFSNLGVKNEGELKPGRYIQLYSVSKVDPNSRALKDLRTKNYKYIVYKIERNGKELNKILLGPIAPAKLNATLKKVRQEVSKGAYTFTIK